MNYVKVNIYVKLKFWILELIQDWLQIKWLTFTF